MPPRFASALGRGALVLLAGLAAAAPAAAQTIRPLVVEHGPRGAGRIELVNDADWPLDVVLEVKGFIVNDAGDVVDIPLDPGIHVALSAMSLRIPPKQQRYVFYQATADQLPAWFVVYAAFRGFPAKEFQGANVQLELPHVAYLLPKERLAGEDVEARLVSWDRERRQVVVDVLNFGGQFGRILTSEIRGSESSAAGASFPLLPHGSRRLEVPWPFPAPPTTINLKSSRFSLQRPLTGGTR